MLASWQGQDKVVELLLDSGADVQQVDDLEDTAFHLALAPLGNERTAKLLVECRGRCKQARRVWNPPALLGSRTTF
jgi:ankyrin repeat protein